MPTFNLYQYRQAQAAIPNGRSISVVPNGAGMGGEMGNDQGTMLSDGNPGGVAGEGQKPELRDIVGDILLAADKGAEPNEIARLARRIVNISVPDELSGNDEAASLIVALGRRATENQSIDTTDPESGQAENSLGDIADMIAQEAGWDSMELIQEAKQRGGAGDMSDIGGSGGVPPVATAGFLTAVRQLTAADKGNANGGGTKNPLQKKKKGNPFKVLMGRVQKLLDHGIDERNQVVRTLMRQKGNRWKRETIEKAFTIVKDRNVRDERARKDGIPVETPQPKAASFNMAEHLGMKRKAEGIAGQHNESPEITQLRDNNGSLPKYAWPGGYPMYYLDKMNNVLCPDCANENDDYTDPLVAHDVNYEDTDLSCDHCSNPIEAAYADDTAAPEGELVEPEGEPAPVLSFNMAEYLGMKRKAENEKPEKEIHRPMRDSLYSVDRPLESLSLGELVSRLQYAVTASNSETTMIGENLVAYRGVDKAASNSQAEAIRAELKRRGYNSDTLKQVYGIPDATKPNTDYQGKKQPDSKQTGKPEAGRKMV